MRNNTKGIFFVFDGVITVEKEGSPTMLYYISKEMSIPRERLESSYYKYNQDLLYGNITHKDMWDQFCTDVGYFIDYKVLEKSFMNVTIDDKILDYIMEMKKKYLIGIITDNKVDRIHAIINSTALKGLFDVVVISANVHSRKNEKKIFEEALKQSGLSAEESIFIDNTESNLIVPSEMGFSTIYFDDEKRDYSVLFSF